MGIMVAEIINSNFSKISKKVRFLCLTFLLQKIFLCDIIIEAKIYL